MPAALPNVIRYHRTKKMFYKGSKPFKGPYGKPRSRLERETKTRFEENLKKIALDVSHPLHALACKVLRAKESKAYTDPFKTINILRSPLE